MIQILDNNNSFDGIFSNSFLVLSDLRTKLPHLLKQFPQFSKEQIEDIANQFDPTNNKIYITWILKQIINSNFKITNTNGVLEDATVVNRRLSQFEKIKNRDFFTHERDINKYSTPKELYKTLDLYKEYLQDVDRKEQYKEEKKVLEEKGYVEVYNKEPFEILKVISIPVAVKLSRNTDWCVRNEDSAKHYLDMGPLYFIYKNNEQYALLHVESNQLADTYNDELEPEYRLELEPIFVNNGIINNINYKYNILKDYSYKPTESELQYIINNAKLSYEYALNAIEGRFELGEKVIATDVKYSFLYARTLLKGRFELGEKAIATSAQFSYWYAEKIIGGRFELGEPAIATDAHYSCNYAYFIIEERFKLGEPIIANDAHYSVWYAKNVLKPLGIIGFPLGEKAIATSLVSSYNYAEQILEGRFELGEPIIAPHAKYSYMYAFNIIKGRFELGEERILSSSYKNSYLSFLKEKGYDIDQVLRENGMGK